MTDTSTADELPPQTNGIVDNGLMDEEERARMRPADIDADVREMERRKRVELIMNSKLFREELERIIETQLKDGSGTTGLLQQISDMVGVNKQAGNVFKSSSCVIPINDIRGIESMGYAKGEKILRCKLAAVFRLIDLYGWTQNANTLITARLNQEDEQFLVSPYGMLFHEMTASSLIKVDMQGSVLEQGTTNFSVNVTAFSLHAAVHAARPDLRCIIHVHTPSVVAVSALKHGLLPLSQESVVIGEVSTHSYLGGLLDADEKDKLARNLGPINKVLLLSNQGALCCGETIEEAFFNARNTILASDSQLKVLPLGIDNLVLLNDEARKKIYDAAHKAPESTPRPDQPSILEGKVERKWRVGGIEFEALMRMMDNAGFRTGYIYRHPLVKGEPPKPRNDVEVPPAVSSLGYLLEEEELYRQGLWKKLEGGRKGHDRSRWLNSPNVYQKVEILETGTPDPKKITKWVAEGSPSHSSTPVRIDAALQFVPQGTTPREFKQKQQQIKDYRRADKISAGPQSHILEGVTWEEARKMQDAAVTQTGDHVVLMGAASKGIIQRGHQHNAMVYKSPYAKNPFDCVTDEELEDYKKVVEKKAKGEYDTDYSESEGLSSAQINKRLDGLHIRSPTSVTSETEEESRDEPQILRIETTTAPKPSQPEVVLSDVDSPVEQFLRTERASVNSYKSFDPLTFDPLNPRHTKSYYRTNSHAGLPKGSYVTPNPVHYHIARIINPIRIMRPIIKTISKRTRGSRFTFGNYRKRETRYDQSSVISLTLKDAHSVALDISLDTLKSFICPFARALNFIEIPIFNNQASQTSYMTNFERRHLAEDQFNVEYTPLYFDTYSETLHSERNSNSFERQILSNLQDNLISELTDSSFTSENLNENNGLLSETVEFDENDQVEPCEGLAEIPSDLAATLPENSSDSSNTSGKTYNVDEPYILESNGDELLINVLETIPQEIDNHDVSEETYTIDKLKNTAGDEVGKGVNDIETVHYRKRDSNDIDVKTYNVLETISQESDNHDISEETYTIEKSKNTAGEEAGKGVNKIKTVPYRERDYDDIGVKSYNVLETIPQESDNHDISEETYTIDKPKVTGGEDAEKEVNEIETVSYRERDYDGIGVKTYNESENSTHEAGEYSNEVDATEIVVDIPAMLVQIRDRNNVTRTYKVSNSKLISTDCSPGNIKKYNLDSCDFSKVPDQAVHNNFEQVDSDNEEEFIPPRIKKLVDECLVLTLDNICNKNLCDVPQSDSGSEPSGSSQGAVAENLPIELQSSELSSNIFVSDDIEKSIAHFAQQVHLKNGDSPDDQKSSEISSSIFENGSTKSNSNGKTFGVQKSIERNPLFLLKFSKLDQDFTEGVSKIAIGTSKTFPKEQEIIEDDESDERVTKNGTDLELGIIGKTTSESGEPQMVSEIPTDTTGFLPKQIEYTQQRNLEIYVGEQGFLRQNESGENEKLLNVQSNIELYDNQQTTEITDLSEHPSNQIDNGKITDRYLESAVDMFIYPNIVEGNYENHIDSYENEEISNVQVNSNGDATVKYDNHQNSNEDATVKHDNRQILAEFPTNIGPPLRQTEYIEEKDVEIGRSKSILDEPEIGGDKGRNIEEITNIPFNIYEIAAAMCNQDISPIQTEHVSNGQRTVEGYESDDKENMSNVQPNLGYVDNNLGTGQNVDNQICSEVLENSANFENTTFRDRYTLVYSDSEFLGADQELHDRLAFQADQVTDLEENGLVRHYTSFASEDGDPVCDQKRGDMHTNETSQQSIVEVADTFSSEFLKVVDDYETAIEVIKEVKCILQRRNIDADNVWKSVDEGVEDLSVTLNNDTESVFSENSCGDTRIIRLAEVIRDYLIEQGFEMTELVVFPELTENPYIIKLIANLKKLYRELFQDPLNAEQRNRLRLSIANQVLNFLAVDKRFADDSASSDNLMNISDKMFTISEYVSEILDSFFESIDNEEFSNFSRELSIDSIAKSTPDKRSSLPVKESDSRSSQNESPTCIDNSVTTFKKDSTLCSESLWIAISPSKPPVVRPKQLFVNVDEIPLRPPADLVNMEDLASCNALDRADDDISVRLLSPIREEARTNLFDSQLSPDYEIKSDSALSSDIVDETDNCTAGTSRNSSPCGGSEEIRALRRSKSSPEVNIVVCNEVNFYRSGSKSSGFSQTSNIIFTTDVFINNKSRNEIDEENKENCQLNDSGDWMGFEGAKF